MKVTYSFSRGRSPHSPANVAGIPGERLMIGELSIVSVVVGTAFTLGARRYTQYREAMETVGGVLLIAGFALLGYSLERMSWLP